MSARPRILVLVYLALIALLAATIMAVQLDIGLLKPVVNLGIAATKAALILWFFMHLRTRGPLVRLFAFGGFAWLILLLGLGLSDWLSR
jgi:cytochrome c oxidase subunit 4